MSEEIRYISDSIVSLVDPCAVILYGAKYSPDGVSVREVSLCVIVENDCQDTEKKIYKGVCTDLQFNLLVYSSKDWDELKNDCTSYAYKISSRGVLLYGRA